MRKTHFKINTIRGPEERKIKGLFKHNNRLFVIHNVSDTEVYRCSDYLTGMCFGDCDSFSFEECKMFAKEDLDTHKDFDFSKFKELNKL